MKKNIALFYIEKTKNSFYICSLINIVLICKLNIMTNEVLIKNYSSLTDGQLQDAIRAGDKKAVWYYYVVKLKDIQLQSEIHAGNKEAKLHYYVFILTDEQFQNAALQAAEKEEYANLRKDIKLRDDICNENPEAISKFIALVSNRFRFMIVNIFNNVRIESAEEIGDMIQDFFVFLLENNKRVLQTYLGDSRFETWLYTVADRFFKKKREKRLKGQHERLEENEINEIVDPDSIFLDSQIDIYSILSRMGLRRRTVLIMLYLAKMTPQETATAMNRRVDNVFNLKRRALIEARFVVTYPENAHVHPPVNEDPNHLRLMSLVAYLDGKATPEESEAMETAHPFLQEDNWHELKANWRRINFKEWFRTLTKRFFIAQKRESSGFFIENSINVFEMFGKLPLDCTTVLTLLYIASSKDPDAATAMGKTVKDLYDVETKALKAIHLVAKYRAAELLQAQDDKNKTTGKTSKNG
ncbi:MAG: hypothetical protein LBS42_01380 [Tannerella sp.]|nr:hypothetical protein [Tannerella sp.]